MECIVCLEETNEKTLCNHFLCNNCLFRLDKEECPYCRQKIERNVYKELNISFYHFIYLFHKFYKDNHIYQELKKGVDKNFILNMNTLYYIEEIDNFDIKGITLQIYNRNEIKDFPINYIEISFSVKGLDEINNKHIFRYSEYEKKGFILENYFNELKE